MAKPEVVVVAEASDKVLYINFFQDGESIPNTLFRLQHPGMLEVEKWGNQVVTHKGDGMDLNTTIRTKRFFKECVFPVDKAITPEEDSLIAEYGVNNGGKPEPEKIHPRFHSLWHRVSTRFLDGDLWNDIPESRSDSDNRAVTGKGKGKG
ncbi:MAG: hypothetical protein IPL26_19620 [Leptospiraceae bacterium]|nr:hypothetical protein [Leptospiraceae bacterium]